MWRTTSRVSTLDQDLEKNKADILRFANHHDLGRVHFVEEFASGRTSWRERRIAEVLEGLRADDALIVAELSRLGCSMLECMEILALATRRGIRVYSVKGDWHLDQSLQESMQNPWAFRPHQPPPDGAGPHPHARRYPAEDLRGVVPGHGCQRQPNPSGG